MTDDLVAFLKGRLDEDEQAVRAATPGPWLLNDQTYPEAIGNSSGTDVVSGSRWNGSASVFNETADALHIAHWNPARVLAEVEVKRQLLTVHKHNLPGWCSTCDVPGDVRGNIHGCATLRLLALSYAGHPDYREEWRP